MPHAILDQTMLDAMRDRRDGWENLVTQIGTSGDKREGGRIKFPLPNTSFRKFQDLYVGDDLAATIAELPAAEMVRTWITVKADDPSTDGADDMSAEEKITVGKRVAQKMDEIAAQQKVFESIVWARVFGGSLLFLGIDDGGGDSPDAMAQPLNEDRIRAFTHLDVFDRWDVHIASRYSDPRNPKFGQPEFYRINTTSAEGGAALPTDQIHESRFIRFDGVLTNRRRARDNGGWSDSIYTRLESLIRDYNLAWGSIAHILQDFAQAIFKMRGLRDAIVSDKDDLVLKRMAVIDRYRSSSRAVPLDSEQEDFDRKQTPVSGLPELMDRFALRLAAGARQPATLLFGQSPAGMQATGASDIRFFYDQIAAKQQSMLRPRLERLIRLVLKSADGPTRGVEPEDWSFDFNPLFELTELEEADLRNKQANTDQVYLTEGVVTEDEVAFSRFGGDRYSADTVLDLEARAAEKLKPEPEPPPPIVVAAPGAPAPAPTPGADPSAEPEPAE